MVSENEYELTLRHARKRRAPPVVYFSARNARPNQVLLHVVNFSKTKSCTATGSPRSDGVVPGGRACTRRTSFTTSAKTEKRRPRRRPLLRRQETPARPRGRRRGVRERGRRERRASDGGRRRRRCRRSPPRPRAATALSGAARSRTRTSSRSCTASTGNRRRRISATVLRVLRQQTLLDDLEAENLPFLTRRLLCRSLEGRRCDVLLVDDRSGDEDGTNGGALDDIARAFEKSDPPDEASDARELEDKRRGGGTRARREPFSGAPPPSGADKKSAPRSRAPRPVAMLCCRVHPGETPSSHALWGFVSYLCGRSKSAEALRRRCAFAVVPMLNPDGCFRGNYRTDSRGRDLNRHWVAPSPDELPTLHAAKALASRLARDPRFRLDFFVDVHAHTSSKCSFFFVNPPSASGPDGAADAASWERVACLPRLVDGTRGLSWGPPRALSVLRAPEKRGRGGGPSGRRWRRSAGSSRTRRLTRTLSLPPPPTTKRTKEKRPKKPPPRPGPASRGAGRCATRSR